MPKTIEIGRIVSESISQFNNSIIQYHLFEMKYLSLPLVAKIQKMVWVVVFVTKGTYTWNSVGSLVFCLYMVAVI